MLNKIFGNCQLMQIELKLSDEGIISTANSKNQTVKHQRGEKQHVSVQNKRKHKPTGETEGVFHLSSGDFDRYFEKISKQVLAHENCAVWYWDSEESYQDIETELGGMIGQLREVYASSGPMQDGKKLISVLSYGNLGNIRET